jgi:two-component system nitrogen regulation sensor histidine kinase NtrY
VLNNLVGNAVEAAAETGGGARIRWLLAPPGHVEIVVEDDGPGIAATANLFVPFFTTKPNGSGIGLVLSRAIVEAHGGRLALHQRDGAPGCQAVVTLPARARETRP